MADLTAFVLVLVLRTPPTASSLLLPAVPDRVQKLEGLMEGIKEEVEGYRQKLQAVRARPAPEPSVMVSLCECVL